MISAVDSAMRVLAQDFIYFQAHTKPRSVVAFVAGASAVLLSSRSCAD